jgi:hypothetical protein
MENGTEAVEITVDDLSNSRFLKKEDLPPEGLPATIDHVESTNVAPMDEPPEYKYTLHWREDIKPLVLNKTNAMMLESITGSRSSVGWKGLRILLKNDPSVPFKGKRTGGIRIQPITLRPRRAHKPVPMTQAHSEVPEYDETEAIPSEARPF